MARARHACPGLPGMFILLLSGILLLVSAQTFAMPSVHFYYSVLVGSHQSFVEANSPEAVCVGAAPVAGETDGHYTKPMVAGVDYYQTDTTRFYCSMQYNGRYGEAAIGIATCGTYEEHGRFSAFIDSRNWTCVCKPSDKFMADTQSCVTVYEEEPRQDHGRSVGPVCGDKTCGQPIQPANGNMWHVEVDYRSVAAGGLALTRTYNSLPYMLDAGTSHTFGARWTQPYDAVLVPEAPVAAGKQPGRCFRTGDSRRPGWCERTPMVPAAVPEAVSVLRGDGKRYYFNRVGTAYVSTSNASERVEAIYAANGSITGWLYTSAMGDSKERFGPDGLLYAITARKGTTQRLTYSDGVHGDTAAGRLPADAPVCGSIQANGPAPAGKLVCVTDHYGRQLQFTYDAKGRISKMIDPGNGETTYEYDGPSGGCATPGDSENRACSANNLSKVTYPDGKSHTYFYNERASIGPGDCYIYTGPGFGNLPNTLTGLVDENGARYIDWTYTCDGIATSSQLNGGVDKVNLQLIVRSTGIETAVTHYVGDPAAPKTTGTTYNYRQVNGVARDTGSNKPCVECGTLAARTFDTYGNVDTTTDWNGRVTKFTYDLTRNLETTRREALGTTAERLITTEWHPTFRLPAKMAEPKRIVTYKHDDHGNILSRTEQATTDETGKAGMHAVADGPPRVWTYTYYPDGQVKTVTGPRTDVVDLTRYTYDTQGNLETVTNALGHVTRYANYDAHGHVGRIDAPNGTYTTYEYNARGWLQLQTTHASDQALQTQLDYDGVGQLKKVTLPDGSVTEYSYDDAHRLYRIGDSLGNSIVYTLDLTGNRIREQVSDPAGVLARQLTRIYDTTGKLTSETGVAR